MRTADDVLPEVFDTSKAGRFAAKASTVLENLQLAADSWAMFRRAPSPTGLATFFGNVVLALDEFSASMGIAKLMGLDLQPFRLATAVFEDAQRDAQTGKLAFNATGGMAGRVTIAMRDARMTAKQMLMDSRALRSPDKSLEYMAFCAAASAVYSSLALVAKMFRLNTRVVLKAANVITAHSQALSTQALETEPQPEAMVMASWVRRATLEFHRDPKRAMAMIEGIYQSLQRS